MAALSRLLARARTLWESDEVLFCLGMRNFDITIHHPHPPGFPLYIGVAKLLRFVIPGDFHALQAINLTASVLVFPAVYLLARTLRLPFRTAMIAATLFSVFPNVWFFGGTAFSDVPSIVLAVFAVVFLLRGADSRRDYWLGTLLLAIAVGIRPQNLLIGLFPGILATWRRRWTEVIVAVAIGAVVVGAAYGGAMYASGGYDKYMSAVRAHGDYIAAVDSFRSPERPPLWRLFDRFFIKQYQWTPLSLIVSLFVIVSIAGSIRGRSRSMLWNLLIFGPFAISAWLMLDRFSITRFSIGYAPMFALFAADGIERVARHRAAVAVALAAVITSGFVIWTVPAFTDVRREASPPVRAVESASRTIDPQQDTLYVGYSMTRFVDYLAPRLHYRRVLDDRALPLAPAPRQFLLAEQTQTSSTGSLFSRRRGRLWNIARRHYFDVQLQPVVNQAVFGNGWYAAEQADNEEWRWMSGRGVVTLPPASGETLLRLYFTIPRELLADPPHVRIALNGRVIDQVRATTDHIVRELRVIPAPNGAPNTLELSVDRVVRSAPPDGRILGLQLGFLSWGPRR